MATKNVKEPEKTMAEAITKKDKLSIAVELLKNVGIEKKIAGSISMQEVIA